MTISPMKTTYTRRRLRGALAAALLMASSAISTSCATPLGPEGSRDITLLVAPEKVPCVGLSNQSCLLVRQPTSPSWEVFYDNISGFNYQSGFDYELVVRVTPVRNPPADGSSLSFRLVQQVRKTRAIG